MNDRLLAILNYLSDFNSEKSQCFGTPEQRKEHEEKATEIYKILVEEIVDLFVDSRVIEETSKISEVNKTNENSFEEFYRSFSEDPKVKVTIVHELVKPKWGLQEVSMDDVMYALGYNLGSSDIDKVLKEARCYLKEEK
jgi:anion-transporting  ArsA/GET3 family ATPase